MTAELAQKKSAVQVSAQTNSCEVNSVARIQFNDRGYLPLRFS